MHHRGTHATPVISKGPDAIIMQGPIEYNTMKIDCSMWLPPKGGYYRGHVEIMEDSLVVAKKNKLLDNVLNDVMFGVLSGLLKAKEHMRKCLKAAFCWSLLRGAVGAVS